MCVLPAGYPTARSRCRCSPWCAPLSWYPCRDRTDRACRTRGARSFPLAVVSTSTRMAVRSASSGPNSHNLNSSRVVRSRGLTITPSSSTGVASNRPISRNSPHLVGVTRIAQRELAHVGHCVVSEKGTQPVREERLERPYSGHLDLLDPGQRRICQDLAAGLVAGRAGIDLDHVRR